MDLKKIKSEVNDVQSLDKLYELEIKFLGRNGAINKLLSEIKNIADEEKREYGQKINTLKNDIKKLIETKKLGLLNTVSNQFFDKTLPGKTYPKGSLHIMTYAVEEITRIFEKIGFSRASYPEVEWEYFSFESLNMPKGHPARDDFETFFIDTPADLKLGKMVLTPHTSSGQNREIFRKSAGRLLGLVIAIMEKLRQNLQLKFP